MRIHLKHIQRTLRSSTRLRDINRQTLQNYVNARSKEAGRKAKNVGTVTIKKELTSFGVVWKYALDAGYVSVRFPNQELRFSKTAKKPRFQTWSEIEMQITGGGLSETEKKELWEALFLTLSEVDELLAFVQENARYEFLYPMVVAAAHTGARRSELIRSQERISMRIPERVFLRQTRAMIRPKRISWAGATFMAIDAVWKKAIDERGVR